MADPVALSIAIREATPDDAPAIARLSGELGYPVDADRMRERLVAIVGAEGHAVFVACAGAEAIGWVHVAVVQHVQSDPRAEIGGLVVADGYRGARVGARLVERAEQWARDHRLPGIVVRSQIMREDAHRFYLREGYQRTKTSAVFGKEFEAGE